MPRHASHLGWPLALAGFFGLAAGPASAVAAAPAPASCSWHQGSSGLNAVENALCRKGDAASLLSAFVASWPMGVEGAQDIEPDFQALSRAYAIGKDRTETLWLAAVPLEGDPNARAAGHRESEAAERLTQLDPDNAMAWLTLAYVKSQQWPNVSYADALSRAAHAPRFHDYAFDVLKQVNASLSGYTKDPAMRWAIVNKTIVDVFLRNAVAEWLHAGCSTDGTPVAPDAQAPCKAAQALLRRGDSAQTLVDDADAMRRLASPLSAVLASPNGSVAFDAIASSRSFAEFSGKLSAGQN